MNGTKIALGLACLLGLNLIQDARADVSASPKTGVSDITGDKQKFRENLQITDGFFGGIEKFSLSRESDGIKVDLEGRALYEKDLGFNMNLAKEGLGSLKVKVDAYPRYYDSSVVYYPSVYKLNKDLRVDSGLYGIEANLALPDMPKLTAGYERKQKNGDENLYWGGRIRDWPADSWLIWTNPLSRKIDYKSNKFYLGAEHSLAGFNLMVRQEWDKFDGTQAHSEPGYRSNGVQEFNREYGNNIDNKNSLTTVALSKGFLENKSRLDMGYQYQTAKNNNSVDASAYTPAGALYYDEHSINYNNKSHAGETKLNSFNANLAFDASRKLSFFGRVKYRKGNTENDSYVEEEGSGATLWDNNRLTPEETWTFATANKEKTWTETLGATMGFIPKTKVTVKLDLEQSKIERDWNAAIWTAGLIGESTTGQGDWKWVAEDKRKRSLISVSARSHPFDFLSVFAKYKYKLNKSKLRETLDWATRKPGDNEYTDPVSGAFVYLYYPGFIEASQKPSTEYEVSLDFKPVERVSLRPSYSYAKTEYKFAKQKSTTERDPIGKIAEHERRVYGMGVDVEPIDKALISVNYSLQDAETWTLAETATNSVNRNPYTGGAGTWLGGRIGAFDGSSSSLDGNFSYGYKAWKFDGAGGYVMGKGNFKTKLQWFGLRAERTLGEKNSVAGGVQRRVYAEKDNGKINDYTANTLFLSGNLKF